MERNLKPVQLTFVLAKVTMQRVLRRKSTYFFLLLGLFPCIQFFWWILDSSDAVHSPSRPWGIFLDVSSHYYLTFYLALLSIFMGLGVINDELQTGNYVFLRVRPLPFWSQVLGRFLGYWFLAGVILSVSIGLCFFSGMLFQIEDLIPKIPFLIKLMAVALLALGAYMAVITAFGTTWKWFSVLASCLWLFLDNLFSIFPAPTLLAISVKHHILSCMGERFPRFTFSLVPPEQGIVALHMLSMVVFMLIAVAYATWWLSRYETKKSNAN